MKVIRFIGLNELEVLVSEGKVKPIHETWSNCFGMGVKKNQPVLWFFPFVSDDEFKRRILKNKSGFKFSELDSPWYRLSYVSGIVASVPANIDGENESLSVCIHLDIPKKDLVEDEQTYADPEGGFYSTMIVTEYLLHRPYLATEVEKVELYFTYAELTTEFLHRTFQEPSSALEYLKQRTC